LLTVVLYVSCQHAFSSSVKIVSRLLLDCSRDPNECSAASDPWR
jgi:hypothetical protein